MLACSQWPAQKCSVNGKDYYGYMYLMDGQAENHTPVRRYDTSAVTQIGVEQLATKRLSCVAIEQVTNVPISGWGHCQCS